MDYTLADVPDTLRRRGTPRHRSWVEWLIQTGRISRPPKDSSGRFRFGLRHLRQIARYLDRGRP